MPVKTSAPIAASPAHTITAPTEERTFDSGHAATAPISPAASCEPWNPDAGLGFPRSTDRIPRRPTQNSNR